MIWHALRYFLFPYRFTSPSLPPHYTVLKEPYYYTTQLFIMRQRDGRSKGSAFIRYFDRRARYTPGTQCCTPSHKRLLQPLALRVASPRT